MRVSLDGTPLIVPTGGVARYTRELSCALAQLYPQDEFWLSSDQPFEMPPCIPGNLKRGPGPRSLPEKKWWLWGLQGELSRLKIDVFHGTDFSVPYLPLRPSVMTVHDLSPWLDSTWHSSADRVRSRTPVLLRLGLASMVITPTEAIRREVIERFRLATDRVRAVPLAAASRFRRTPRAPGAPYFLYVGTLEPRKNISRIVEAWREIRKQHAVDLILAGRMREDFAKIPTEQGLEIRGETPEEDLPALYSGAIAFLYPSFYEGFGLPVLEAMQCAALVIASKDAAVAEVTGGAAILLDSADERGWVEAMLAAIREPDRFEPTRAAALDRAGEFSWRRTAMMTREVYEEAIRRFRH